MPPASVDGEGIKKLHEVQTSNVPFNTNGTNLKLPEIDIYMTGCTVVISDN